MDGMIVHQSTGHNQLTSEKKILQATSVHILVDQQPVFIFVAVSDELHQVWVSQLPKQYHFRLKLNDDNYRL